MNTSEITHPHPRSSRRQMWVLIGLFFAPLIAAFILYYGLDGWRPPGSTNHGDLITPPRPLPAVSLSTAQDVSFDLSSLHGKWTLAYVGDGQCDARCREALVLIRQTRLALNDNMDRTQRLFVASSSCCDQAYLEKEHPGIITVRADGSSGAELLKVFPEYADVSVVHSGRIYIIDPLGNLMMSYAPAAPPKGLLQDLKKLLKLSHIG